ncbi:phage tail sheath C-terminal domain-containing protein [Okeania sp. SIO1I7]|uniref:phage tail sheath family protein n=1 Tax=Okeania sp. SIO1I7 TaxID=2607772 RepID=UPI0025F3D2E8|nr:phage tail sheath C-terminal domain-containing protein [Okeania sp. SIO1I7]
MVTYKTPNVYVEEISTLPPSVASVSTAIPAFIGYTDPNTKQELINQPILIRSLLDYETFFGQAEPGQFDIEESADEISIANIADLKYLMYYALQMFFDNGGSSCYIVSVGTYENTQQKQIENFEEGLDVLEQEDEPTLILLTDATNLDSENDYYDLCQQALAQCNKLKDRFAIFDVLERNNSNDRPIGRIDQFRDGIGTLYLKYGAAYHPYLQTSLNYYYTDDSVSIDPFYNQRFEYRGDDDCLIINYTGSKSDRPKVNITIHCDQEKDVKFKIKGDREELLRIKVKQDCNSVDKIVEAWNSHSSKGNFEVRKNGNCCGCICKVDPAQKLDLLYLRLYRTQPNGLVVTHHGTQNYQEEVDIKVTITINNEDNANAADFEVSENSITIKLREESTKVAKILKQWKNWKEENSDRNFDLKEDGDGSANVESPVSNEPLVKPQLWYYQFDNTELYNKVKTEIDKQRVILPPSPAIAGIYATVDRERGVWKAPANISLTSVTGPTIKINDEGQEDLNVHFTGKSINAIRTFTGKGTLVWGARTLAGNDNEWRYVSVRRLFNFVEESIQKASGFLVFESNNSVTWLKVKSVIEIYLEGLWRQGALAGSAPDQAFFVNVGLGTSMTQQDILEGRMIVEIGIAAVRPAEFIILRFSHKLQEA